MELAVFNAVEKASSPNSQFEETSPTSSIEGVQPTATTSNEKNNEQSPK